MDVRDWTILILVSAAWAASTVFLFLHPDAANFATFAGLSATMVGSYHWLSIKDDKSEDKRT